MARRVRLRLGRPRDAHGRHDARARRGAARRRRRPGRRGVRAAAAVGRARRRARHGVGAVRGQDGARARRVQGRQPVRGRALADVPARAELRAVRDLPAPAAAQPVAVRLRDQPRRRGVARRREPRDVRALRARRGGRRRRPARRDVSDLGHDRARRRRARGREERVLAARVREGGERAHDVHRRRPQRQGARVRAGERARARPPPDRDVLSPDPHGRPRRGLPARGLRRARRVPLPHVGRDRDGRAEELGDPLRRAARGVAARVVRRRGRPRRVRRLAQHGPHAAHGARALATAAGRG